jgi:hypothetical protein
LQGSYRDNWQEILEATEHNEQDEDANYIKEQVPNLLSDIFAKKQCSEMAHYLVQSQKLANFGHGT